MTNEKIYDIKGMLCESCVSIRVDTMNEMNRERKELKKKVNR